MSRTRAVAGILFATTALLGATAATAVTKPKVGATCTRVGQTATIGGRAATCVQQGSTRRWQLASAATTTTAAAAAAATTAAPTTVKKGPNWDEVVAAAKKEGKVTIYSSQALDNLNELGARFKKAYGIDVEVVRIVDADIQARLTAERQTNKPIADIAVLSAAQLYTQNDAAGWYVPPVGPTFTAKDFNRAVHLNKSGNLFVPSAAVLTYAWNTQLFPQGMKDFDSIFDQKLVGRIGIIDVAVSPTIVDFYLYLEENFGSGFLAKLSAWKPRIYGSALTVQAALSSGEIAATIYAPPQGLRKAQGLPVDSGVANPLWGARFFAGVMANAPHSNAAQVLADFMMTKDGQEAIAASAASAMPGISTAVTTTDKVALQDLSRLTPQFVSDYNSRWNIFFR